jgi:hypothetical protein
MPRKSKRGTTKSDPEEVELDPKKQIVATTSKANKYLRGIVGVPKNNRSLYRPEYDDLLIEHLASGKSFMSFDVAGGVSYKTLRNWCDKFPSFAEAREIGEKAKLRFLEDEGVKMVKGGNVIAWKFMMNQQGVMEEKKINHEHSVSPHMQVAPSVRYMRLQKIKELHQRAVKEDQILEGTVVEEEIDVESIFDDI